MVDNNENILVEFDYQNISVIDPNKVVDENGMAKERLINQEDLVFYANLECSVIPRTKLALGVPLNDAVKSVSVGKINFLNPGNHKFLEEIYIDEITGKDTLKGKGINQQRIDLVKVNDNSEDYFFRQTTLNKGKVGAVDTGMLGITQINIDYGLDFEPVIQITMEDVKGRALFESGNNSPYAAFFQLPYPIFYLTIKGYLGKAVRLPLMLQKFNASFDPGSANFRINTTFYTYKYTILSQVNWRAMWATPLMFQSSISTTTKTTTNNGTKSSDVEESWSSRGYSKIKELYAEYKSKGLIDDNFPELTVQELQVNLNKFLTSIIDKYSKTNLNVINDMKKFKKDLDEYQQKVFYFSEKDGGWARKYLDFQNTFVMETEPTQKNSVTVYQFKSENIRNEALTELQKIVLNFNTRLKTNGTLGDNKPNSIPIDIKFDINKINEGTFIYKGSTKIDIQKTYSQRNSSKALPNTQTVAFEKFINEQFNKFEKFFFQGKNSFIEKMNTINENYLNAKQKIEEQLTADLLKQISKSTEDGGLGFAPTVRNILAIFFAQGEAFLRLMDDVHNKAWELRDDTYRKQAIFSNSSTVSSVDIKDKGVLETPIYPWPQLIVENTLKQDGDKYELVYPGNLSIASKIRAYSPEIWPEVQFVEEFLKASVERGEQPQFPKTIQNIQTKPNRLSFNAIEFPISNEVYQNTEEVKFFYEIYERLLINAYYSKLSRDSNYTFSMYQYYSESEVLNMINALGSDNPYLSKKLKEYGLNSDNYIAFLQHISNGGTGESWQNFVRGEFNTPYLKNDINTPFVLINQDILDNDKSQPLLSVSNTQYIENYFGNAEISENFDFTDLYPVTDLDWVKNYMANGKELKKSENVFKTNQVLEYSNTNKIITNFAPTGKEKAPVTTFNYKSGSNVFNQTLDLTNLKTFYETRLITKQYITEGNVFYSDYQNKLTETQTTSMLNTPYFINAIQKGVYNFRYSLTEQHPYKLAAYLFLNSLPLGTLKEKYREYNDDGSSNELNYILSTFKKYGAVHRLPYAWVLKYGSIWHRYKVWKNTGVDMLDEIWTDFNYLDNFDPQTSASTKNYELTIDGSPYNMVLQDNINQGGLDLTYINTGFYPKVIDDFNVFYQGVRAFDSVAQITGTFTISNNVMNVTSVSSNDLFVGLTLSGSGVYFGTTIINQINGTIGGVGEYTINYPQEVNEPTNFIVTNYVVAGYTSQSIQSAIQSSGLYVKKHTNTKIEKGTGFDNGNQSRSLQINPWSCYIETIDRNGVFLLPSFGSVINQVEDECFKNNGTLSTEVENNPAMYNGSVRLFWKAPNYGYFDNERITKPSPEKYLKEVFNNESQQQSFSLNGDENKYSSISEMFTTFDKYILDLLETEFLNFSKSVYDYSTSIPETNNVDPSPFVVQQNFQALMRDFMKLPLPTPEVTNGNTIIEELQELQITNFSQKLSSFMEYFVTVKHGNPSFYDRKLFYSFSNLFIEDKIEFQGYFQNSPNSLPTAGGNITLAQSQTQNPEIWKTLETYVGFSEIPELVYSDNGSYITDFFIDMNVEFTENSVKTLAPIIKLYATQKLKDPTMSDVKFYALMTQYIETNIQYINTIINLELTNLRKKIGTIDISPINPSVRASQVEGEQTRYETWELFKTINDTWISGSDLRSKTLFEDVMIVDRASRDVGQKIYVDVFKLKNMINSANYKNRLLDIIYTILTENNFVHFTLPAYANFYNVKDVSKNPTPKPEGTLEFAQSLFGTFLNVDYRETGPKLLAIYAWKPSEHLAMNENVDYRYRDDAFDMRRSSDNPLLENLDNKTNWDKSNKVVGFNVDIGPQNQQIFKQLDISQDPGEPTAESLEILNQMANLERNRGGYSQSVSLYNLYKNRSYKCGIDMMGNALIQPTMYFNLRNVPMFSGPYMITKVQHRISENGFDTSFEGQRQPFYSIPKVETFIQNLAASILENVKQKQEEDLKKQVLTVISNISAQKTSDAETTNKATLSSNQNCSEFLAEPYKNFTVDDNISKTSVNKKTAATTIRNLVNDVYTDERSKIIGGFIYSIMKQTAISNEVFETYGNNYSLIPLTIPYGEGLGTLLENKYFCDSRKNKPNAVFGMFNTYVSFMISKYGSQITEFEKYIPKNNNNSLSQNYGISYAKFYYNNYPTINGDAYSKVSNKDKRKIEDFMAKSYTEYVTQSGIVIGPSDSGLLKTPLNSTLNRDQTTQNVVSILVVVLPNNNLWKITSANLKTGKGPDPCVAVTNVNLDTNISQSKQQFFITTANLQTILNCNGSGLYNFEFIFEVTPVLQNGDIDPDRQIVTQNINGNFTL